MNEINNNILQREIEYKGSIILKYKIEYPIITHSHYKYGCEVFNRYNRDRAIALKMYCENELLQEAKELYEYNLENGYPIMTYEIILNYDITHNNGNIISLYTDQYMYTGGAHGNTIRKSQNWDLQIGKMIPLQYWYRNNPYYAINIIKEINNQIEEQISSGTNNTYFDEYCKLVLETFRLENYYIMDNKIIIFFQQYDIAPYSSGIVTFEV